MATSQSGAQLVSAGVESFLPLREERRRWQDRWKLVEFPMFPGYLFVHSTVEGLEPVWRAKGVARVLGNARDKPTPVPDDQIHRVRAVAGPPMRNASSASLTARAARS